MDLDKLVIEDFASHTIDPEEAPIAFETLEIIAVSKVHQCSRNEEMGWDGIFESAVIIYVALNEFCFGSNGLVGKKQNVVSTSSLAWTNTQDNNVSYLRHLYTRRAQSLVWYNTQAT